MQHNHRFICLIVLSGLASVFGLASLARVSAQSALPPYRDAQLPVEQRVADLIGRMTLEEKVAQTHALWQRKALIMDSQGNFAPEKAKEVLKNGIGQITRASEKKGPRENAVFANAIQKFLAEQTR